MEEIPAPKAENWHLWSFLSTLWKCRMESAREAVKTTEKIALNWQQYERCKLEKELNKILRG